MELTKVKRMDWQVVRRAEVDDYPGHFHVSEIIQYEIFCGQLLFTGYIFSIHPCYSIYQNHFYCQIIVHSVAISHFVCLFISWHLGCFHFMIIKNNAAIWTFIHRTLCIYFYFSLVCIHEWEFLVQGNNV